MVTSVSSAVSAMALGAEGGGKLSERRRRNRRIFCARRSRQQARGQARPYLESRRDLGMADLAHRWSIESRRLSARSSWKRTDRRTSQRLSRRASAGVVAARPRRGRRGAAPLDASAIICRSAALERPARAGAGGRRPDLRGVDRPPRAGGGDRVAAGRLRRVRRRARRGASCTCCCALSRGAS